jgi:hypothetical protein
MLLLSLPIGMLFLLFFEHQPPSQLFVQISLRLSIEKHVSTSARQDGGVTTIDRIQNNVPRRAEFAVALKKYNRGRSCLTVCQSHGPDRLARIPRHIDWQIGS